MRLAPRLPGRARSRARQARASLAGSVRLAQRRQAAAVATGFVESARAIDLAAAAPSEPRRQRVAVLTKGMDVLCLDHNLNLLWERSLEVDIERGLYVMYAHVNERARRRAGRTFGGELSGRRSSTCEP